MEKAREFQKDIYFCFIDYALDMEQLKPFISPHYRDIERDWLSGTHTYVSGSD